MGLLSSRAVVRFDYLIGSYAVAATCALISAKWYFYDMLYVIISNS